jgi:hypothetical protein
VLVVSAVMAGLVPAIDTGTRQGWFGSRRDQKQSDGTRRPFACRVRAPKHVDGRAKPGHDVWGSSAGLSAGLRHTSVARARLGAAAVQRPCKYAQGTWFALVCAADTVHGRGESEALATGAARSGSALDVWPLKYAQDTWLPLVCAAEGKQGSEESDSLSTAADCAASDVCPLVEERATLLAGGWASGGLADAGLTCRWGWGCDGGVGGLPVGGMTSTAGADETAGEDEEAVGAVAALWAVEGGVMDVSAVVDGLPAKESQPTAPATARTASVARAATRRRRGADRCLRGASGFLTSTK